jgi:sugar transferase (PEP-CTERM/EpsH1 system associated)
MVSGTSNDRRPLVCHVMHRFDTGGLENGVVNLVNHMPAGLYRHAILAMTDVTDFRRRILRDDVEFVSLRKPPGQGVWQYPKLYRIFRRMRPHIVHSRNLSALEAQVPAWAARVPVRIHGEHGRDVGDLDGSNVRLQRARRLYRPFVHHYVALSRDLADYLAGKVHVPARDMTQIYNGVDTDRFAPSRAGRPERISGCPFDPDHHWLIGTVGRMQTVKDQATLARAFVLMLKNSPALRDRTRLVMVGDGPLREQVQSVLAEAGVADLAWLPGERSDVPQVMRGLHAFVLPSVAEGISNTILEAMASALPVIATDVGGNADLLADGETGEILPASDPQGMADRMTHLATDPERAVRMGRAGRERVIRKFSMASMVAAYRAVYDQQLRRAGILQQDH